MWGENKIDAQTIRCDYGVGRMVPDSPAERSGQLFIGDHLLAVNNQDVSNMEHGDIVGLIKRSGLSIRLLVQQPQSTYVTSLLLYQSC